MDLISAYIQETAGEECDVILGMGYDNQLGDAIGVTIIATGFDQNGLQDSFIPLPKPEEVKVVRNLNSTAVEVLPVTTPEQIIEPAAQIKAEVAVIVGQKLEPELKEELMPKVIEPVATIAVPGIMGMSMRPKAIVQTQLVVEQVAVNAIINPNPVLTINTTINTETQAEQTQIQLTPHSNATYSSNKFDLQPEITPMPKVETVIIDGIEVPTRVGSRILSEDELREKALFERNKLTFEERASKLRSVSVNNFNSNTQSNQSNQDMHNIPAYIRAKMEIDNVPHSSQPQSISHTNIDKNGNVETKNAYLSGEKKD
jgi:cell division protein FtsZ